MDKHSLLRRSFRETNQIFLSFFRSVVTFIRNILFLHKKKYMFSTFSIAIGSIVLALGLVMGFLLYKLHDLSDIKALDDYDLYEIPSVVYDIHHKPIKIFSTHKREIVSYDQIPTTIIDTLLSAEDRTFFTHKGVNIWGISRAMLVNIFEGRVSQGGSTLTQQLAKLLFTDRARSISRKLKELIYTLQIEKKFTKEEILEKYLNKVYYGNGIYSIAAASRFYFGISLDDINYAQAALLISIPPNPTYYNPLTRPMNVKARQSVIMTQLIKEGKLTPEESEQQTQDMWETIQTKLLDGSYFQQRHGDFDLAPYFSEYIRRILFKQYGHRIYTDGYKIYTTLDLELQQAAQKSLVSHLKNTMTNYQNQAKIYYNIIQNRMNISNPGNPTITEFLGLATGRPELNFYLGSLSKSISEEMKPINHSMALVFSTLGMNGMSKMVESAIRRTDSSTIQMNHLEGALISLEAKTGRIYAMVGGTGFNSFNQINRVTQARRQPGSTFKPFLYLSAISSGRFTAASTFEDKPIAFQLPDGTVWTPGNSARNYQALVTLRDALRKSINIVSVKLIQALGISQAINFISELVGLPKERFRFDSSLALGTSELTPMELDRGYATIANGGTEIHPHGIILIKNRYNQIIDAPEDELFALPKKQLVDPRYNYIATSMMQDVFKRGTATRAAVAMNFPRENVAGKTGTASNMSDAWFSGFTSQIATTVWIGFDQRTSLGVNGFGSVLAEPIWIDYMKVALKKYPASPFPIPDGVVSTIVHRDNGLLMPTGCLNSPQAETEYFTQETLPTKYSPYCDKKIEVDLKQNFQMLDTQDIFASSVN